MSIREARYVVSAPKEDAQAPVEFPETIESEDNNRFATFEAIQAEQKKLTKPSRLKAFLSKAGFPLSRE